MSAPVRLRAFLGRCWSKLRPVPKVLATGARLMLREAKLKGVRGGGIALGVAEADEHLVQHFAAAIVKPYICDELPVGIAGWPARVEQQPDRLAEPLARWRRIKFVVDDFKRLQPAQMENCIRRWTVVQRDFHGAIIDEAQERGRAIVINLVTRAMARDDDVVQQGRRRYRRDNSDPSASPARQEDRDGRVRGHSDVLWR